MAGAADGTERLAKRYARFAEVEAGTYSPSYRRLALHVSRSAFLLAFLSELPPAKQQPNLFLAAVRSVAGVPRHPEELEDVVVQHGTRISEIMLTHTTQTNEPARCAVLLPLLATLPQPLALLEVGAAAGLCLLPDRYGYDYGAIKVDPKVNDSPNPPVFPCDAGPGVRLPGQNIAVAWRAGLDLSPLDVNRDEDIAWLEKLVWPEHRARVARLRAAVSVARADPPPIFRGDLLHDLHGLAAKAPEDATLVIYHTAVLGYVGDPLLRNEFAAAVRNLGAVWISNEAPAVFPELSERAGPPPSPEKFLLALDGKPVAWSGPHGQSLNWIK